MLVKILAVLNILNKKFCQIAKMIYIIKIERLTHVWPAPAAAADDEEKPLGLWELETELDPPNREKKPKFSILYKLANRWRNVSNILFYLRF